MKTRSYQQTVQFQTRPRDVYDIIMDPKKHQSLTGEKATNSKKVGGRFTAWGPYISGFNLVLSPGQKIVQAWRANEWLPDHYSIVIFELKKVDTGTELQFSHIGVPVNFYRRHYRGFIEMYWTPIKELIATGSLSDKTRTKVRAARDYIRRKRI